MSDRQKKIKDVKVESDGRVSYTVVETPDLKRLQENLDRLNDSVAKAQKELDSATAERDRLQALVDGIKAARESKQ